jgi:hypothetical protein
VEAAAELGRDGVEIVNDQIGLLRLKFLFQAIRALPTTPGSAGQPRGEGA